MKKTAFIVIAVLSIALLAGCGRKQETGGKQSGPESDRTVQAESSSEDASAENHSDNAEKTLTGTLDEKKDFMFVVRTDQDIYYAFDFESKPDGLDELKVGDVITVTYTGTVSEIDPFIGEIISVVKVENSAQEQSELNGTQEDGRSSLVCEYTNLTDDSICQKVDRLLEQAGISKERRDGFRKHVDQFNSSVDASVLYGEFVKEDILEPEYDSYDIQEQWMEKNPDFNGYNCRITAFELFGDYLSIDPKGEIRDDELFMDMESLEQDNSALIHADDLDAFRRLYSTISTEGTKDVSVHAAKVQNDWSRRGIRFEANDKASLITVWFHDIWPDNSNELFIGHAGILLSGDDGLYFVEKLAFQEPYQVVRFDSRKELETYLMKKYDTSWGQETASPFIMENDRRME